MYSVWYVIGCFIPGSFTNASNQRPLSTHTETLVAHYFSLNGLISKLQSSFRS